MGMMMKNPSLYTIGSLQRAVCDETAKRINGHWYPARPIGYPSFWRRCRIAWGVFAGRYDAVEWPAGQ